MREAAARSNHHPSPTKVEVRLKSGASCRLGGRRRDSSISENLGIAGELRPGCGRWAASIVVTSVDSLTVGCYAVSEECADDRSDPCRHADVATIPGPCSRDSPRWPNATAARTL